MVTITKVFAENIRRLRAERNMTQTELADAIGISLASIQGYEAERVWPAMDTVKALAKALKVSEPELFRDPSFKAPLQESLLEFARLLSSAHPMTIEHALKILEVGQPKESPARGAKPHRTAKS